MNTAMICRPSGHHQLSLITPQQVASDTHDAMTIYSDAARDMAEDMQVVTTSSAVSVQALSEVSSVWTNWFGKAARANAEFSQQLLRSRTLKDVAEVQREFATSIMHNWLERHTAILEIAQRTSEQARSCRKGRTSDAA